MVNTPWKCPGCGVWHAPNVTSCYCEAKKKEVPEKGLEWKDIFGPYIVPDPSLPRCFTCGNPYPNCICPTLQTVTIRCLNCHQPWSLCTCIHTHFVTSTTMGVSTKAGSQ